MKKTIFLCCIAVLFTASAYSQILEPVTWSYSVKKTSVSTANVFIKATIDKGWHLYSQVARAGGPTPTVFSFRSSKVFDLVGKTIEPKPITMFEPVFFMEIGYFENTAIFQQKVKLKGKNVTVNVKVEYMACNDKMCLPPTEREFSIRIK
ncbi:putative exported cytochrome C biogenesis-related protein [Pedobacter sp. BAL39]|uniref:protein-disulfide reductase DsbD domain-containing protein n=1 Tax=Pedobacter sp. BAL39 TaxID=391596 RepID=UPI0001559AE9|nr:protein-disulfide reductase DsbD domain-containing protein [Pedobacter sp. BAL39]EDM36503.1 putative exported cytochrome C biogenesis-related protein [Pedobacter sp. BAL39]